MKRDLMKTAIVLLILLFSSEAFTQTSGNNILSGVDNPKSYETIELINMDRDLSTFANLLRLSGLDTSLAVGNEPHTLFVPVNKAFVKMSIQDFAALTNPKNRTKLIKFINNHFLTEKHEEFEFKSAQTIRTGNDSKIEISKDNNELTIGGANVIKSNIESANGIIYVIDQVLDPTTI